jgi:hypothetical protein
MDRQSPTIVRDDRTMHAILVVDQVLDGRGREQRPGIVDESAIAGCVRGTAPRVLRASPSQEVLAIQRLCSLSML